MQGSHNFYKNPVFTVGLSPEKNKTLTSVQKTNLQTNLHRKFRKKIDFRVAFSQGQVDAKWTGVYMFLKLLKENKHVNQLSRCNIYKFNIL